MGGYCRAFGQAPAVVADTVPLAELWMWQAWIVETDPWRNAERQTDGYVAQEAKKRLRNVTA